ncbi:substrate-binding domain-containing protein [Rhizobium rosettiformans]|uniref:Phosphonate ABC transporter substrate-binding protein n=2 Tax=Rhizobium rosettiformans TaxID=1368430 RepID=A0A4V4HQ97_9HYPH|nr:substrate-binding domain-containing protein [Rhizobium rosettiformans]MBA4796099.1 substrate-binding domain-containing protein [Hyphomicrobiales bacterium]MBB5277826.1 phosphate transport system substrate-binding protein [Rhizobium rosettiformans]MDR7028376.1 phosphate transport system substrate-binding protein [Rhizobium rosettiformans]MDR7064342.1 phosphate transport system substrate-binding protein [Rhizobium rosettiformans]THV32986.1 phosphonate ABC transporter substrate-binding protein
MNALKLSVAALAASVAFAGAAVARDQIQIAGSSTVLPYASIVAEAFGENTDFATPVVESGGSGAGRKKLCEGVGENTIDIANSSSRISKSDIELCKTNGVNDIQEVRIGYDGIVFASDINGPEYAFTPSDWHNALAAKVLKDGQLVDNPYKAWNEIRADLPAQPILAFIPGTKHGTREVFDEKVIIAGCEENGAFEALKTASNGDEDAAEEACMALRTDGVSVDIDGDYTETLARVDANKNGIGVFGLSFYQNNTDKLRVATMGGVVPSVESIAKGEYPVSRPLYFYVKNAHLDVIPGLQEYVEFFVSDEMAGPDGPLAAYGLVSDPELAKTQEAVKARTPMAPLN